jgi:hypothetical protein
MTELEDKTKMRVLVTAFEMSCDAGYWTTTLNVSDIENGGTTEVAGIGETPFEAFNAAITNCDCWSLRVQEKVIDQNPLDQISDASLEALVRTRLGAWHPIHTNKTK